MSPCVYTAQPACTASIATPCIVPCPAKAAFTRSPIPRRSVTCPMRSSSGAFMPSPRFTLSSKSLLFLSSCYFAFVLNLAFWRYCMAVLRIDTAGNILFALGLPFVMVMLAFIPLCLLLWPATAKPVLAVMLCVSAATNFAMFQYGIYFDATMIRNLLETNSAEALDLVTPSSLLWVLCTGGLPAALLACTRIHFRPVWQEVRFRLLACAVGLLLVACLGALNYKEYAAFGRNHARARALINVGNYVYSSIRYTMKKFAIPRIFVHVGEDAKKTEELDTPTVFVLVVGEAARAGNFSLNGYARNTNPLLSQQDIINFDDVASCGTATAVSVPCMFSGTPRKDFDVDKQLFRDNVLDILQRAGYSVLWLENDGGGKGVPNRVSFEDMPTQNNPALCTDGVCLDEVLLERLKSYLPTITKDTVIVLHTMGSHGPSYYKRYPERFRQFTPTCDTAEIQQCPQESIVNTYDNTILYTDFIVSSIIDTLKRFPQFESGMLYVADHGESLGENNIYLHGLPYAIAPKEQTHIPMVLWMSDSMKKYDRIDYACLKQYAAKGSFSHQNLFHSLLGLMEVESAAYSPEYDLFNTCRQPESEATHSQVPS